MLYDTEETKTTEQTNDVAEQMEETHRASLELYLVLLIR